jgi:hypothetical protein
MSLKTGIQNLRADMKVRQETANAQVVSGTQRARSARVMGMTFACAFVMMLAALAVPASAAIDINATVSPLISGITALIPSIVDLIVSIVPAIITLAIVGFIVKFLDKILSMLSL